MASDRAREILAQAYEQGYERGFREGMEEARAGLIQKPRRRANIMLMDLLDDGPMPASVVYEIAKDEGFAKRTIKRAKAEVGVVSIKRPHEWIWALPKDAATATGCKGATQLEFTIKTGIVPQTA